MAEAPNTAIAAILTILIVFVVVLMVYYLAPDTFSEITDIADEVFYAEQYAEEELETKLTSAYNVLFEDIDKCYAYDNKDCTCQASTDKDFPEGSYLYLENDYKDINEDEKLFKVTVLTENTKPLAQADKEYSLGLFVVKELGDNKKELGCVFPDVYYVIGEGDAEDNNWYMFWKDSPVNKWFWQKNPEDTFGFYSDYEGSLNGYAQYLNSAPNLYSIGNSRLCVLTDMIEFPLDNNELSGLNYVDVLPLEEKYVDTGDAGRVKVTNFQQVGDFFTKDKPSCS